MNNLKKIAIGVAASGILLASALPAFAAAPVTPNCLGSDVSGFAQNGIPLIGVSSGSGFGGFLSTVATTTTTGVGDEFLAHLQGASPISTCPTGGFPTPLPLP